MGAISGRHGGWAFAFAALSIVAWVNGFATAAWAQAQRSDEPKEPLPTTLSGDWGGLRPYLERKGLVFTLSYTNDFLSNVRGGIGLGTAGIGAFQPQLDIDLQKLLGWQGGHLHTHGLVTHGPFFSQTYLGNILAVSNLEAGPVARLYSLWYEQSAFDGRFSVRFGLMSADSQFLQSKTAANFINNGISWPTFLAANLPAGGPAYPLPDPGIRVRIKPTDEVAFQAAVFSGDPSGGDGSNQNLPLPTGTVFSFRGGAFFIAEATICPTRARTPRDFPALTGSARGITPVPASGINASTIPASRLQARPPLAFPSITPATTASTASSIRCSIAFPAPTTRDCRGSSAPAAYRATAI
jgi:porin